MAGPLATFEATFKRMGKSKNEELPLKVVEGPIAYDMFSSSQTTIGPKMTSKIPTGILISSPWRYAIAVLSRKKRLKIENESLENLSRGEIQIVVINDSCEKVTIERGENIDEELPLRVAEGTW